MAGLYLIARIGAERIALDAGGISSVVDVDAIAPVPRVAPHIAGLFALRSRVLTAIDSRIALDLPAPDGTAAGNAIVVDHDGHSYALLVDAIEDMVEGGPPAPCPAPLDGAWARAARGVVPHEGVLLLLIDPAVLIAGAAPEAAVAA